MSDAEVENVELSEFAESEPVGEVMARQSLDVVKDVTVELTAVLGNSTLTVGEMFGLQENSVVTLDTLTDQPVDLLLDGHVVARGRLVVTDDHFGVQITESPNVQ